MKKIIFAIAIFFVPFILVACDSPFMHPPTEQQGTIWLSDMPTMYFYVDSFEDMGTLGYTGDNLEIKLNFGHAYDIWVFDNFKMISQGNSVNSKKSLIFKGDCKFKKTQFTITVTASEVDWVEVGDKIVFNRVEELPEWAAELESVTDE